ncbi:MAG: phosphoribosyl-ATP diphosphatase [Phycisphaerae bacterium]|nr:phosphoribosyl-ATP diphosphatase [Phycisphaerae bacterium]
MLIPSIDLLDGRAVQLRQGRDLVLDLGDPRPLAERFAPFGEIAVVDLDAARGTGSNATLVRELLGRARCRVGGGIRDRDTARRWLDDGAERLIVGTRATPEFLSSLPRDRLLAAVDARDGEVVVEGWTRGTCESAATRIAELRDHVGGFLVTFVEVEGTLAGFELARAESLLRVAGDVRVTFAGGIASVDEIAALDRIGADAQVGMALHAAPGRPALDPADCLWACLRSDRPDGLVPTAVCDRSGQLLSLAYSDRESLRVAAGERRGAYRSRTRGLWRKGETSGARQRLLAIDADCDRDTLRFVVEPEGPACHAGTPTCFGPLRGLAALDRRLRAGCMDDPASYTARLRREPELLADKLREEADELAVAVSREAVVAEAADVAFFSAVKLASVGASVADVDDELTRRARRVTRRGGERKGGPRP